MAKNIDNGKTILFQVMLEYWRSTKILTISTILLIILGATLSVAVPFVFSRAVDILSNDFNINSGVWNFSVYAFVFGLTLSITQASQFFVTICTAKLEYIANVKLFYCLLQKSYHFFLEHNSAKIAAARSLGEQTISILSQITLGGLVPGVVRVALSVVLLGQFLSWEVALIIFIYGGSVIGLDLLRVGRVKPFLDTAIDRSQENSQLVGNALAVIETLRQTRSETWITGRFASSANVAFANWRRYALLSSYFAIAMGILAALQLYITFVVLLPEYNAGMITIGDIVLFNLLLAQLNEPFHMIGMSIRQAVEASAHLRPLLAMWLAEEVEDPDCPIKYKPIVGGLDFENVSFKYVNGRGITGISFRIRRGKPTFIVGETGAGKSTIVRLLLKGAEPCSGIIRADGIDLSRISRTDWFQHVGVVPQDAALLNDSISANIVLGRKFDPERLNQVALQASIFERIQAMPEGFETLVGERGFKLSGGERQRIAIARALYGNPQILILDEASSALDEDTERQVMSGLRSFAHDLTIVSVTHRLSSIQAGDQVIRL